MSTRPPSWLRPQEYLASLASDGARLSEVAREVPPGTSVPTCPGWSVVDLLRHCADVYSHKVAVLELGRRPEWGEWPLADQQPAGRAVAAHDEALARLVDVMSGALAQHGPQLPAWTWLPQEQTLAFWLRRMAHEALVHRVDGEVAAGVRLAPSAAGLAQDGVDEVLTWFAGGPGVLAEPEAQDGSAGLVLVRAGQAAWQVWLGDDEHSVTALAGADAGSGASRVTAQAELAGTPLAVNLELWGRRAVIAQRAVDGVPGGAWAGLAQESGTVRWEGDPQVLARLQGRLAVATG